MLFLKSVTSALKSISFAVLSLMLLVLGSAAAKAETLSIPVSRGFIGTVGSSTGKANSIMTFSTLGVTRAYFIQESDNNQFGGTQGNDYSGTVRLVLNSGEIVDIAGAVNWRDTAGSTLNAIGFIPAPGTSASISYGSGSTYTISATSNFGLQTNTSTITYTDGTDISGNAAKSGLLQALNDYLAIAIASAPTGPVTVNAQATTDQTPIVTGSVTLASGETLFVVINGKQYSGASVTIDPINNTWSVSIADADALPYDTYDVTATIVNASGYSLVDAASQELTIYALPRFVDGTDGTVTSYTDSYFEMSTSSEVLKTVRALDADSPTLTYSIQTNVLDGASAPIYAIDSSTGEITLTTEGVNSFANDFETAPNAHTLTVRASDGVNTVDATVTLNELDVD